MVGQHGEQLSGLHLLSDNNKVVGLNIAGFSGNGILIEGSNNKLIGNYIGDRIQLGTSQQTFRRLVCITLFLCGIPLLLK